jgi:hypothetical protein
VRDHISIKNQISKNTGDKSVEYDEFIAFLEKFLDVVPITGINRMISILR